MAYQPPLQRPILAPATQPPNQTKTIQLLNKLDKCHLNSFQKFPCKYHYHRPRYLHRHHTNKISHLRGCYRPLIATFQHLHSTQSIKFTLHIHTSMVSALGFVYSAYIGLQGNVCVLTLWTQQNPRRPEDRGLSLVGYCQCLAYKNCKPLKDQYSLF